MSVFQSVFGNLLKGPETFLDNLSGKPVTGVAVKPIRHRRRHSRFNVPSLFRHISVSSLSRIGFSGNRIILPRPPRIPKIPTILTAEEPTITVQENTPPPHTDNIEVGGDRPDFGTGEPRPGLTFTDEGPDADVPGEFETLFANFLSTPTIYKTVPL